MNPFTPPTMTMTAWKFRTFENCPPRANNSTPYSVKNRDLTVKEGMERLPLLNLFPVSQSDIGDRYNPDGWNDPTVD